MNKEQALFEHLTLSDFKMWSSSVLKNIGNYSIIVANNPDNISCLVGSCFLKSGNSANSMIKESHDPIPLV